MTITAVGDLIRPVSGARHYDPFIQRAAEARFVLLGEASHGTHGNIR